MKSGKVLSGSINHSNKEVPQQAEYSGAFMELRISCNFPPSKINDLGSQFAHTLSMNLRIRCCFLEMPLAVEVTETTNSQ